MLITCAAFDRLPCFRPRKIMRLPFSLGQDRLSMAFAAAIVTAVVATAFLVSALLYWSTLRVDQATLTREFQIVETVLAEHADSIGYDQESVTVWDDTVEHLRAADLDLDWLDGN